MRRIGLSIWLLTACTALAVPGAVVAQVVLSISIAPPELPIYEQPEIPAPGYIWAPGYWAYGPDGYYWVPGTWVEPPRVGFLWTPGYWGWRNGVYAWNAGYWGPHIGFYGGVNYGFGYGGSGYEGGRWNNGVFVYNRTVNNFGSVTITNVYNQTVTNTTTVRSSFNGGTGGTTVQPTPQEQAAASEQHVPATASQTQHEQTASTNKALLASVNHGNPTIAATSKPGEFSGKGVVAARESKPGPLPGTATPGGVKQPANRPAGNQPLGNKTLGKEGPSGQPDRTSKGATPPKPLAADVKPVVPKPKAAAAPPKPPPPPRPAAPKPPSKPKGPPPKEPH